METKKLITINIGSASKKYAIYENTVSEEENIEIAQLHIEHLNDGFIATYTYADKKDILPVESKNFDNGFAFFIHTILKYGVIVKIEDIETIGIRIVAPSLELLATQKIDNAYMEILEDIAQIAPLHIIPIISEIKHVNKETSNMPIIGVSDSLFHKDLPTVARRYALPKKYRDAVPHFGYHGLSVEYVLESSKKITNDSIQKRIVVCHLGSGSSITAVKNGKSIDTSMGFSPMDGLPMGTRVGSIDAGALIYLQKRFNLSPDNLDSILNEESGLLGLSNGKTSDMRKIIEGAEKGDAVLTDVLSYFIYAISKQIGAYASALNGIDMIIFTGTIGERSAIIREHICRNLEYLSVVLDTDKQKCGIIKPTLIHKKESAVQIAVIPTNEMTQIAKKIQNL
jgi:acetate kinase